MRKRKKAVSHKKEAIAGSLLEGYTGTGNLLPPIYKTDDGNYVRDLILFDVAQRVPKYSRVEIDASIYPLITELNKAGFVTNFCCSGLSKDHFDDGNLRHAYVGFDLHKMSKMHVDHLRKVCKKNSFWTIKEDSLFSARVKRLFVNQVKSKHLNDEHTIRMWIMLSKKILGVDYTIYF